ncbi:MAG: PQQ-binding-like beta-propeller repeat protein [Bythopirellula sp.]
MAGLLISPFAASTSRADDWPQWRGPTRDSRAAERAWPSSLGEDNLKLAWRVPLGPSYSGPVVVGNRVFTTETRNKTTEVVSAYDLRTGEHLWSTDWPGAMTVPFFAASNGSWIRATPACDDQMIFVAGIRDVLVALDQATGDVVWKVDFTKEFGTPLPSFGFASSPLVHDDALFVQAGGGFVKIDKRSGAILWRTAVDGGGMSGGAFSSPLITTHQGRQLALVQTRLALKGIDPESGEEMWSQPIKAFRGMNILTPTVHGGHVFTSAHTGQSQLWQLPVGESDESNKSGLELLWTSRSQAYMSSPVVVEDHLYLHLRNQRIQCIDLKTGEETWRTTPFGKYQSMAVVGTNILALDQRGELILFRADPNKFDKIDSRKLGDEETWAHIAISGNQIFIRELNGLAAYDWN